MAEVYHNPSFSLLSPWTLKERLSQPAPPIVIDCRFAMAAQPMPDAGYDAYRSGHIPDAVYADLDRQLSDPVIPGITGRHPLPSSDRLMKAFRTWGIQQDSTVVVYDQNNSSMAAARAWWVLRYAGLEDVRVLNGGLDAWLDAGFETEEGPPAEPAESTAMFTPDWEANRLVSTQEIQKGNLNLIDARSEERYAGKIEPIDPIAGHIPGAACLPFTELVDEQGKFLPVDHLKNRLEVFRQPDSVAYCGSGVTACHLILACVAAGLPEPRLYAGSWSEWITDPDHPVARDD